MIKKHKNCYRLYPIILLLLTIIVFSLFAGCGTKEIAEKVTFDELSEIKNGERVLSEKAQSLDGQMVNIKGWISPISPLGGDMFYLIRVPGAECPFCANEEVDYFDFLIVHLDKQFPFTFDPISVTGILEIEKSKPTDYEAYDHNQETDDEYQIFLKIKNVTDLKIV
ncbi:hypothetical protein [Candidatus Contubernalis alkaliaceticus]|uniref:hypothetical protein n=1 Tax=Candidatus Contubernalis alkaliaceticus TaxID=338645 RepID=UPI001F4C1D1E|nr:hypothetical protein [Candidatus Contubernalis alkalaceticus]UNC92918.1 hypothetical protein HUE98_12905 [Candidatus Contubernalis alkalaceticus]